MAKGVIPSEAAFSRIKNTVRKVEGAQRTSKKRRGGQVVGGGGFRLAQLTSDLEAGGTATADLGDLDDDNDFESAGLDDVTVVDMFLSADTTAAEDAIVGVDKLPSGKYVVTVVKCSDITED